jgi:aspartate 1-decarboxylase
VIILSLEQLTRQEAAQVKQRVVQVGPKNKITRIEIKEAIPASRPKAKIK